MSKKITALLCFIYFSAIIFSVAFVALEITHDCTGEDCPICGCVVLCQKTLRQIFDFSALFSAASGILFVVIIRNFSVFPIAVSAEKTPVALKIKLSN
ncbi:MAG: hypothetical protein IJT20_00050 [Synergistaceae bacterium]|nr:hypothetical protein [Synergistaceae bacterium]